MVNELASRCQQELQEEFPQSKVYCVATGGLANLIGRSCNVIEAIDNDLTLRGLWILFARNDTPE